MVTIGVRRLHSLFNLHVSYYNIISIYPIAMYLPQSTEYKIHLQHVYIIGVEESSSVLCVGYIVGYGHQDLHKKSGIYIVTCNRLNVAN